MYKEARITPDGKYRYYLLRQFNLREPLHKVFFVMLNPSTADAMVDDPTIRKCIGFADRMGGDTVEVLNLFAIRTPSPKKLKTFSDPIGIDNDEIIKNYLYTDPINVYIRKTVICAWGTNGGYMNRDKQVLEIISECHKAPMCLGETKHGYPRHPLYVPYSQELQPYMGETND